MKCYLVHAYFSGGLDRQIAFNFNIIHVFIERYVFLKKTWGFSNEDWKFVAKARNEKSSGVSYASTFRADVLISKWTSWSRKRYLKSRFRYI